MKKTKAQRRVAVAKDALQQLKLGKYRAVNFYTIMLPSKLDAQVRDAQQSNSIKDAQSYLKSYSGTCDVCVRGALFLSLIRKENDWPLSKLLPSQTDYKLDTLFSYKQYKLMEAYYEGWDQGSRWEGLKLDPEKRLVLILKNVIKNNGLFKPSKLK